VRVAGKKMIVVNSGASLERRVAAEVGRRPGSAVIGGPSKTRVPCLTKPSHRKRTEDHE
jgi:hypothetical protein